MKYYIDYIAACAYSSIYDTMCFIVFELFSVDSPKRTKTVVWTGIDRCVFDDNKN